MPADTIDFVTILHLLKAPSKKTVLKLCDNAAANINDTELAENELQISHEEAVELCKNLKLLVADVVWKVPGKLKLLLADSSTNMYGVFPNDFHENLQDLLCKIIQSRFDDWKNAALKQQVSWPQVEEFSWKTSSDKCDVAFKTSENNALNVELSKETLSAMLDSLSKIREQISSVAK